MAALAPPVMCEVRPRDDVSLHASLAGEIEVERREAGEAEGRKGPESAMKSSVSISSVAAAAGCIFRKSPRAFAGGVHSTRCIALPLLRRGVAGVGANDADAVEAAAEVPRGVAGVRDRWSKPVSAGDVSPPLSRELRAVAGSW